MERIAINGTDYVPADSVNTCPASLPVQGRAIIVVDRGWIFAGDVRRDSGRIHLSNAVWVFKWDSCGFSKVVEDPSRADIRAMAAVEIPEASEVFCVPVAAGWGL